MAQLPCIGLYKPCIDLPLWDCAMYFDHGVCPMLRFTLGKNPQLQPCANSTGETASELKMEFRTKLPGVKRSRWFKFRPKEADILHIYGPASLGTSPPPPTPWLWVCIVAPQYPPPPLWCGWCGWWWVVVVEEVVYVCIWMYMYGMNVYF